MPCSTVTRPQTWKLTLTSTPQVTQTRSGHCRQTQGTPAKPCARERAPPGRLAPGAHGSVSPSRSREARSRPPAGLGCGRRWPGPSSSQGSAERTRLRVLASPLTGRVLHAILPSEGESSRGEAAVPAVVVAAAARDGWLGAAAVESGSVSGSASRSRPGVLLR